MDIVRSEKSNLDEGHATGFDNDEAAEYYEKEYKRVNEKYVNKA